MAALIEDRLDDAGDSRSRGRYQGMHKTLPINTDSAAPEGIEWRVDDRLVPYEAAVAEMERRVDGIAAGHAPQLVWLLEQVVTVPPSKLLSPYVTCAARAPAGSVRGALR